MAHLPKDWLQGGYQNDGERSSSIASLCPLERKIHYESTHPTAAPCHPVRACACLVGCSGIIVLLSESLSISHHGMQKRTDGRTDGNLLSFLRSGENDCKGGG